MTFMLGADFEKQIVDRNFELTQSLVKAHKENLGMLKWLESLSIELIDTFPFENMTNHKSEDATMAAIYYLIIKKKLNISEKKISKELNGLLFTLHSEGLRRAGFIDIIELDHWSVAMQKSQMTIDNEPMIQAALNEAMKDKK